MCENYKKQLLLIIWSLNAPFVLTEGAFHSNFNWTFIACNIPYSKGIITCNKTKAVNQFQYPGIEKKGQAPQRTPGVSKTKLDMSCCRGRF